MHILIGAAMFQMLLWDNILNTVCDYDPVRVKEVIIYMGINVSKLDKCY